MGRRFQIAAKLINNYIVFSKLKELLAKREKTQTVEKPSSTDAMANALTLLNCTYNIEDSNDQKDRVIYFKYQGLNFRAFTFGNENNNDCNLDFHAGVYNFGDLEILRQVTNSVNSSVSPIHYYFISDTKESVFNLYASATLTNVSEIENLKDCLSATLEQFFYSQRNFENAIKKRKEDSSPAEDIIFMNSHEVWMAREMEMNLMPKSSFLKTADAKELLLTDFLEDVYGIQSIEIESIDVSNQDVCKRITDTERIHSYKLIEPVVTIKKETGEVVDGYDAASISVVYLLPTGESKVVMLTLKIEDKLDNAVYVRVTSLREGDCISMDNLWGSNRNMPKAESFMFAVDRTTDAKKKAELKYMWEEACKKKENGEKLTNEELYLVSIASMPQLGDSAYWGRKHFNQQRFAEALKYFENVNEYLENNFFEDFWDDNLREYFSRNCWYMSYCHSELGNATLAVYYAEKACMVYPCPLHQMTFVKALYRANDFRIFHELNTRINELDELLEKTEDMEQLTEAQAEMYEFLHKATALALIRFRKYDDAKIKLQYLIDNASEETKEWAKKKLEELKNNRKT